MVSRGWGGQLSCRSPASCRARIEASHPALSRGIRGCEGAAEPTAAGNTAPPAKIPHPAAGHRSNSGGHAPISRSICGHPSCLTVLRSTARTAASCGRIRVREERTMSTGNLTTRDLQLRDNVLWQLEWDPAVDAAGVGVAVVDATVTLTGYIDTYAGKLAAERAAKQVRGVRAVANEIDVRPMLDRTDTDIADDVVHALRLHSPRPGVGAGQRPPRRTSSSAGQVDLRLPETGGRRSDPSRPRRAPRRQPRADRAQERGPRRAEAHRQGASSERHCRCRSHRSRCGRLAWSRCPERWQPGQRDAAEWAAAQTPGITEVDNRLVVVNREVSGAGRSHARPRALIQTATQMDAVANPWPIR